MIICFVDASLEWETIEQYFLWQLIAVHSIPVEDVMPVLPKLDFTGLLTSQFTVIIHLHIVHMLRSAVLRQHLH